MLQPPYTAPWNLEVAKTTSCQRYCVWLFALQRRMLCQKVWYVKLQTPNESNPGNCSASFGTRTGPGMAHVMGVNTYVPTEAAVQVRCFQMKRVWLFCSKALV